MLEMKTIRLNIKLAFIVITSLFMYSSCQNKPQAVVSTNVEQAKIITQDSISLIDVTVHLVKLDFDFKHNDTVYKHAWLIKLQLDNMPAYPAQRIDFAIGDYIIPEYGGWEKGIYFRVYEEQLLDKLNNAEIRYKLPGDD